MHVKHDQLVAKRKHAHAKEINEEKPERHGFAYLAFFDLA